MTREEAIELSRKAGFQIAEDGTLELWEIDGKMVINKDTKETVVDGIKNLIAIVRNDERSNYLQAQDPMAVINAASKAYNDAIRAYIDANLPRGDK